MDCKSKYRDNMYLRSRLAVGISRDNAADMLHIDYETLGKYERGQLIPPDEMVIAMAKLYGDAVLVLEHLFEQNPIGRMFGWKIERKDLPKYTLGFLRRFNEVEASKDRLIAITDDGIVDPAERPEFGAIMEQSDRMILTALLLRFSSMTQIGKAGSQTKKEAALQAA